MNIKYINYFLLITLTGASYPSAANTNGELAKDDQKIITASLEKELPMVNVSDLSIGDLVIKGGFPGHAVVIVDMAQNKEGKKIVMIAQSYMPAQNIHVLRNAVKDGLSPWQEIDNVANFITPEWTFYDFRNHIRRYK